MVKSEVLRKYDLIVVVDAKSNNDDKASALKEVTDAITKAGGKVINTQLWLEKHRLFFRIKNRQEGSYYIVHFEAEPAKIREIQTNLRIKDRLLRFIFAEV